MWTFSDSFSGSRALPELSVSCGKTHTGRNPVLLNWVPSRCCFRGVGNCLPVVLYVISVNVSWHGCLARSSVAQPELSHPQASLSVYCYAVFCCIMPVAFWPGSSPAFFLNWASSSSSSIYIYSYIYIYMFIHIP